MAPDNGDQRSEQAPLARDRFRVAMSDTDAARVIYFGAPARWAERLVTAWLADVKFPISGLLAAGFGMPAVHVELSYHRALRLDDLVEASLWVDKKSARSVTWRADFTRSSEFPVAVQALLTQVYARIDGDVPVPVPWPNALSDLFGE